MATNVKTTVKGGKELLRKLRESTLKERKTLELVVGYRAHYAIYVHENLEAYHPNGQAKYLETPIRKFRNEVAAMVRRDLGNKKGLRYALLRAGRFLLRESRKLVPVRTGFLRDSGYIELDNTIEATED